MNFRAMQWRLMTVFALFTLAVTVLFGLFAMAFVYTVEDAFIERQLAQEAERQRSHRAANGNWAAPAQSFIRLHTESDGLPADLASEWRVNSKSREFYGTDGRHYHVLPLTDAGMPLLVAEVSAILIVRPIRGELITWLVGWGSAMVLLALLLGGWLARKVSAPLESLASATGRADPAELPHSLPGTDRGDEVGVVARALETLMQRTRAFIEREQAFTRDASHELRTPLSVLDLALARARHATPATAPARAPLDAAAAAATHMSQTVNTLLMLAREEASTGAQHCLVLPLVEHWVLAHELILDARHLKLDIEIDATARLDLPPDVAQLVLANLLDNAVAHGTAGGTIRLSHVTAADGASALLIVNSSPPLPAGVGDAGIKGEASAGFGLGLSIVRRLLVRHGATLAVTHADGITTASVRTAPRA